MEKLIVDGEVAVLYTNNYGSGWSTWNKDFPECLFDPEIAKMVCFGVIASEVKKFAESKYGEGFDGYGAEHLTIKWLPVGTKFYIDEYDGFEEVVTEEKLYMTA